MARITRYSVIEADTWSRLDDHVNSAITRGWEPCGGVAVVYRDNVNKHDIRVLYLQAMVKKRRWFQ